MNKVTERNGYKTGKTVALVIIFAILAFSTALYFAAKKPMMENYEFQNGFPTHETTKQVRDDIDLSRAISAYRFWYPVVSGEGILQGNRDAGIRDNEVMTVATDPHFILFTGNSDTPYGGGTFDLKNGPLVIEMPAGRFVSLVDDHFQRWIMDMGIPGPDAGRGGKYILLPPDYDECDLDPGEDYHIGYSNTYKIILAIRALPENGDMKTALENMKKVKIYYLDTPDNVATFVDKSGKDLNSTLLEWEDNLTYWTKLHKVINEEPIQQDFLPMYGELAALGIEKGKPFEPDARMKDILIRAARDGRVQMLVTTFDNNRPERMAWKDRNWEWVGMVSDNGDFKTSGGMDNNARERWFAQAVGASPAMFRRTTDAGSLYWGAFRDNNGNWLDGAKTYKLTVPLPVPARLFWSVTVYDNETRSQIATDQNKAALRSLVELRDAKTGSVDLYFGPDAPSGHEDMWIKTNPGQGWFSYFRIYGPDADAFNGDWRPGDFELVQ